MKLTSVVTSGCRLASAAACLLLSSAHADTPAFSSPGASSSRSPNFSGTRGWEFVRTGYPSTAPIYITQLGVLDADGDGLANSHQVGLWRNDGTLLASATVPAGTAAPLVGGYRFVPIAPVTMGRGSVYDFIVAAQYSAGDADDTFIPQIGGIAPPIYVTPPQGRYGFGENLPFPNYQTTPPGPEVGGPIYWSPNLQFTYNIPEPAPWRLLAPALFLVLWRRRQAP